MKRKLTALLLVALTLASSTQRAPAPIQIGLGLALKCIAIGVLGETAYILYNCKPKSYLVRVREDGLPDHWIVSAASAATIAKNEGWMRCEGPGDPAELEFRAWCNNLDPSKPMFPCSVLGASLPPPTYTNHQAVALMASTGGKPWAQIATVNVADGEENLTFAVLPATGTNGFTAEQLYQVQSADVVITNTERSLTFRFQSEP